MCVCSYALCPFSHRLVEEADYKATAELFGTKGEEKNLDVFIPKSESDFLEYAEMISHRLRPYEVWLRSVSLLSSLGFWASGILESYTLYCRKVITISHCSKQS